MHFIPRYEEVDELLETLGKARRRAGHLGERAKLLCYLLDMASLEAGEMLAEYLADDREQQQRN
jgi:hypothetical protein